MIHDQYMDYAIKIALRALGKASPNPLVGALIVYKDRILSEGWHVAYGQDHAERMAINNVKQEDKYLLSECTLYVTLEPCNHFGQTPPCTTLILNSGIKKVVYGCLDPNPLMSGKSIQYLRQNGLTVEGPVLEYLCKKLIDSFAININSKRPYIILKWAQSSDFFLGINNQNVKISNAYSDILVHKWRSKVDGICTSYNTWKVDKPKLNVRHWAGQDPKKFVLTSDINHYNELNEFQLVYFPIYNTNIQSLAESLKSIYEDHRIGILFVEAGPTMLSKLINENLWDETRIITNKNLKLQKGLKSPIINGKIISKTSILNDEVVILKNELKSNR